MTEEEEADLYGILGVSLKERTNRIIDRLY